MELDDRALPLTRGQLDIWLAEETGLFGAKWQLGVFVRIAGPVDPDLFESAIRQAVSEAEPLRAVVFPGGWPGFPEGGRLPGRRACSL